MKYTIPYSDKISLPRINEVLELDIVAEDIQYDQSELEGKIIISGEYTVSNESEVMEFTHEIPISFLIDDPDVNPRIDINNFTYDVISGKGLEVNFELDVVIDEHEELEQDGNNMIDDVKDKEEFQENVNNKLNQFLPDRSDDKTEVYDLDEEIKSVEDKSDDDDEKEEAEIIVNKREEEEDDETNDIVEEESDTPIQESQEEHGGLEELGFDDDESEDESRDEDEIVELIETEEVEIDRDNQDDEDVVIRSEAEITDGEEVDLGLEDEIIDDEEVVLGLEDEVIDNKPEVDVKENTEVVNEDGTINIRPSTSVSSSESYYDSLQESYSTYKVYFLDEGQSIDDFCEENDLSRALINDEDTEETRKVVIRVDHE